MLRTPSWLWTILVLAVAVGAARGADAVAAPAPAPATPRITAVTGLAKTIRPGGVAALKVRAVGTTKRPRTATFSATMRASGGRAVRLTTKATMKLRRGKATRGRVTVAIPHGHAATSYTLTVCARIGRGPQGCRRAGTFALGRECSCVQPGPRPAAPAPAPAPAAGAPAAGGAAPATGTLPPSTGGLDVHAAPDPVTVDPTLDTAHAKTASIDTLGGTVTATGADGITYTLEIPYGALLARTDITVTPLKAVAGLPFSGGLVAGAALAPDGLRFSRPVRLTITGAPAVAPDRETPFGYRGDGRELALMPMARDPKVRAFDLMHFSAYGIASGTDAERRAQVVRNTTDVEGRLQQVIGLELQRDRAFQLTGTGRAADQATIDAAMRTYHDEALRPLMQAAIDDVALAPRALNKYLSWDRQLQLLWPDTFLQAERAARAADFLKILRHAAEHYYAKCLAGDPGALPVLLAWSRQLQLMGLADDSTREGKVFAACAQFEVDLETTLDQGNQGQNQTFHGHLTMAHVRLTLQGSFSVMGTGPWQQDSFTILPAGAPDVGCWLATGGFKPTDQHLVGPLALRVNWIEDVDGGEFQLQEADIADVGLTLAPLQTSEDVHWGFCGSSTGQGGSRNWLGGTLADLHEDERPAGEYAWVVEHWTRPANDAFVLTKRYQRTKMVDNHPTTEDTRITLRHAPAAIG